jgi:hypothetical protein
MGHQEIDCVAGSVLIGFAGHSILFSRRLQQSSMEKVHVALSQTQCREEDPSLVAAARMMRVEAVMAEFRNLNNRMGSTGQFHLRLNLADCDGASRPQFLWRRECACLPVEQAW